MSLFSISKSDRNLFCKSVIESSTPKVEFYLLVILSTLIVSAGLIANNIILVIGGMLVTPLLSPILAISLSLVISNLKVFLRSVRIFLMSLILAMFVSFLVGIISDYSLEKIDLLKIMKPSLFTFYVAVVAGLAASYTWAKPELNSALPGIAITVTLIPPLTASGLALARFDKAMFMNTVYVLMVNVIGIIIASVLVLFLFKFYKLEKKVLAEVKEEEKEIAKESIL